MNSLSLDLFIHFCSYLPLKELPKVAVINSTWRNAINQDLLWKTKVAQLTRINVKYLQQEYDNSKFQSWKQFYQRILYSLVAMRKERPILIVACEQDEEGADRFKDRLTSIGFKKVTALTLIDGNTETNFNYKEELSKYSVVLFFSNCNLAQQKEWGDALATFIEQHTNLLPKSVILSACANLGPSCNLLGRWAEQEYDPWNVSLTLDTATLSLEKCIETHPILKGVELSQLVVESTKIANVTPRKGATIVAKSNNDLVIVEKNINGAKVIGVNFYIPMLDYYRFWTSDGSRLFENIIDYACSPQF